MKCATCINYVSQPLTNSPCNSCVHRSYHYRLGLSDNYHFDTKTVAGIFILLAAYLFLVVWTIKYIYGFFTGG